MALTAAGCSEPPASESADTAVSGADTVADTTVGDTHSTTDADGSADVTGADAGPTRPDVRGRWTDTGYTSGCRGDLEPEAKIDCAKRQFWRAFQVDFQARGDTYEMLTRVIQDLEAREASFTDALATLYFRRGQLGLSLVIEQRDFDKLTKLIPDFEKAVELKPDYDIVPPWKDAVAVAKAALDRDYEKLEAIEDRVWRHVDRSPLENNLSISGTTIGLPKSTGYPRETLERLEAWNCDGEPWCTENTPEAPFARPGLNYHFAESYARMGKRQKAKTYLRRTLNAPGADRWPFRPLPKRALENFDEFIGKYDELGEDGNGFRMIYANKQYGCMFCHAPKGAVPEDILADE
ncbi:MAG: hypothetical protein ABEK29_09630 [Bradymonadaceae bacterium]